MLQALRVLILMIACVSLFGFTISGAAQCCEAPADQSVPAPSDHLPRVLAALGGDCGDEQGCDEEDGCDDDCLAACACCLHTPVATEPDEPAPLTSCTPNAYRLRESGFPDFPDPDKLLHVPRSV